MSAAKGAGYIVIILSLVGAGFCHWVWVSGADLAVPGTKAYSYDFKLGPYQPYASFKQITGETPKEKKKDKSHSIVRGLKEVATFAGTAAVGEATGSRAYLWANVIDGVTSYSELNKKICAGDVTSMVKNIAMLALEGTDDCATTKTLQYLAMGSMAFLALGILFAALGVVQTFTGKIVGYSWENVFAFSVAACCMVVMALQICAGMKATSLMYDNRYFDFFPYFGMLWDLVAFVLAIVVVLPCCSGRTPLLEKGDDEPSEEQHQQGQGYYQQGGQYGAQGQFPQQQQQGPGFGAYPGQYSQPQQPQERGAYY